MESLNWVDGLIVLILIISTVVSGYRGFFKELFSLVTWFGAGYVAYSYGPYVGNVFGFIQTNVVRELLGAALVFIVLVVLGGCLNFMLGKVIQASKMGWYDRFVGVAFGLLRGTAIVCGAVIVSMSTSMQAQSVWQTSQLVPTFQLLSEKTLDALPLNFKTAMDAKLKEFSL